MPLTLAKRLCTYTVNKENKIVEFTQTRHCIISLGLYILNMPPVTYYVIVMYILQEGYELRNYL